MSRTVLIVNPEKIEDVDALTALLTRHCAAHRLEAPLVLPTTVEDPGVGMARQAREQAADVVLVAGGDGTVRAVAQGLAGSDIAMGVVPAGTGNLLARNLGLPTDPDDAVELALSGPRRRIDLGEVRGGAHPMVFTAMAGIGLDAAMMKETPEPLKSAIGWPAYAVGLVRALRRPSMTVEIVLDGAPSTRKHVRTVVVGNIGRLQGGLELLPDAEPSDGRLDVGVVVASSMLGRLAGRVLGRTADLVPAMQAKQVTVRVRAPLPREVDGDPIEPGRELSVSVLPAALLLCCPEAKSSER